MGPRSAIPRWFPLYLLFVLAITLSPFEVHCVRHSMGVGAPNPVDVFQNLLLFIPFGWGLASLPRLRGLVLAVLLSISVEVLQLGLPRSPSVWDVAANGAGAGLGGLFAPRLSVFGARLGSRLVLTVLAAALSFALVLSARTVRENDFSNWEPHPLVIGNEAEGSRPWVGTLHEAAIFDRVLDPGGAPLDRPWSEGGPILHGRFSGRVSLRLDGPGGSSAPTVPPRPAGAAPWRLPEAAADHVRDRLAETSKMSIWLRLSPGDFEDTGPGRILSHSIDTGHRNFTVGQYQREVVFRTRTPTTGVNGNVPQVVTRGAGLEPRQHVVLARFEGSRSRVYVDGVCRGEASIFIQRGSLLLGVALPGGLVLCVALVGLAAARWVPAPRARGPALLVAGVVTWAALYGAGVWDHFPRFDGWALALGGLTLATAWWARAR